MRLGGKLVVALVLFAAIMVGALYYFSPHLAARNIAEAAKARDADKLAGYIDFAKVREGLKADFGRQVDGATKGGGQGGLGGLIGKAVGNLVVNPMVDEIVSPKGLAEILKDERSISEAMEDLRGKAGPPKKPANPVRTIDDSKPQQQQAQQPAKPKAKDEVTWQYESADRFVVYVRKEGSKDTPIGFVLSRDGLFSWKVTGVRNLFGS